MMTPTVHHPPALLLQSASTARLSDLICPCLASPRLALPCSCDRSSRPLSLSLVARVPRRCSACASCAAESPSVSNGRFISTPLGLQQLVLSFPGVARSPIIVRSPTTIEPWHCDQMSVAPRRCFVASRDKHSLHRGYSHAAL
jgi:hypothetical protein